MEDGERTDFVSNGWDVYTELGDGEKVTNRLVRGFGIVAAEQDARNGTESGGQAYYYYHGDEHNDICYITGEDGCVKNQYEYDAFGSQTRTDEIVRNRYRYNGEQYDGVTEQYYLRARFYNPVVARFTQEDVYRGDGLNLYAYCGNNGVGYEDPSGYSKTNKCTSKTTKKTNGLDYDGIKKYVKDIEVQTGYKLDKAQVNELKNALRNNKYTKLTPAETLKHRKEFNNVKNKLISEWETKTNQKWPTYSEIIYDKNGNPVRNIGDYYDAHHVIENNYGGDHAWWNITPAKFPNEHQGGIHRSQSPARKLFK